MERESSLSAPQGDAAASTSAPVGPETIAAAEQHATTASASASTPRASGDAPADFARVASPNTPGDSPSSLTEREKAIVTAAQALEPMLLGALDRTPTDRRYVLSSEAILVDFIRAGSSSGSASSSVPASASSSGSPASPSAVEAAPSSGSASAPAWVDMPPTHAFQRKILHQLAQRFNLARDIVRAPATGSRYPKPKEHVSLRMFRVSETRMPDILLADIVGLAERMQNAGDPDGAGIGAGAGAGADDDSDESFVQVCETLLGSEPPSLVAGGPHILYTGPAHPAHAPAGMQQDNMSMNPRLRGSGAVGASPNGVVFGVPMHARPPGGPFAPRPPFAPSSPPPPPPSVSMSPPGVPMAPVPAYWWPGQGQGQAHVQLRPAGSNAAVPAYYMAGPRHPGVGARVRFGGVAGGGGPQVMMASPGGQWAPASVQGPTMILSPQSASSGSDAGGTQHYMVEPHAWPSPPNRILMPATFENGMWKASHVPTSPDSLSTVTTTTVTGHGFAAAGRSSASYAEGQAARDASSFSVSDGISVEEFRERRAPAAGRRAGAGAGPGAVAGAGADTGAGAGAGSGAAGGASASASAARSANGLGMSVSAAESSSVSAHLSRPDTGRSWADMVELSDMEPSPSTPEASFQPVRHGAQTPSTRSASRAGDDGGMNGHHAPENGGEPDGNDDGADAGAGEGVNNGDNGDDEDGDGQGAAMHLSYYQSGDTFEASPDDDAVAAMAADAMWNSTVETLALMIQQAALQAGGASTPDSSSSPGSASRQGRAVPTPMPMPMPMPMQMMAHPAQGQQHQMIRLVSPQHHQPPASMPMQVPVSVTMVSSPGPAPPPNAPPRHVFHPHPHASPQGHQMQMQQAAAPQYAYVQSGGQGGPMQLVMLQPAPPQQHQHQQLSYTYAPHPHMQMQQVPTHVAPPPGAHPASMPMMVPAPGHMAPGGMRPMMQLRVPVTYTMQPPPQQWQ
jgi:hypothetical protein